MSCFLVITKDDSTITETNHSGSTVIRMTDIQNYSPELVLFILRLMMIMRRSSIRQTTTNSTDILCDLTSTVETAWQTNTGLLRLVWSEIKWEKNVSLDVKIACYSNKALILVWWKKKWRGNHWKYQVFKISYILFLNSSTRCSPDTKMEDNKVMCNDNQESTVWIYVSPVSCFPLFYSHYY